MGFLSTHGTTGISPMIIGLNPECFEDEGFNRSAGWVSIDEFGGDVYELDAEDNGDAEGPLEIESDWLKENTVPNDMLFRQDHDPAEVHFGGMALEAGLNPSDFCLADRADQQRIIAAWVRRTYACDDDYMEDIVGPSSSGGDRGLNPSATDYSRKLNRRWCKWGRKCNTWKGYSNWRRLPGHKRHSRVRIADVCCENVSPDIPLSIYVLIEYPHHEVSHFGTEAYYRDLLRSCRFSLADYKDCGDEYFWDCDRYDHSSAVHEREELDAAYTELMLDYHELKTGRPQVPSWLRPMFWDFGDGGLYDLMKNYPYRDDDLGIFEDYQGQDNPNDIPYYEDALADAAWAEIDRLAEEAIDENVAPAFGGSNRNHLRAKNPRGDRERYAV